MSEHGHRPDLDGLRAIAIIPVIFYHLGFSAVPGGFVGVDVFFVLSGYLITRQISVELAENRFSILDFYDRRIRRLFPALFVMTVVTCLAALYFFLPDDLEQFGMTLVTAVLSSSNFLFWQRLDYFAADADTMPLLHTWSLAVEEQFYVVFPLILGLIWRFGAARRVTFVGALAVASLLLSIWGTEAFPEATFYLLPTRAWELLLGALLALTPHWAPQTPVARNAFVVTGLAAVLWAIFTYDTATPFPGLAALLPCVGAALIIAAGQPTPGAAANGSVVCFAARSLTLAPAVFIGLISYSLYLWHWPFIVFTRYASNSPLQDSQLALLLVAIFVAAVLSWRFVEQPMRRGDVIWPTRARRFGYALASAAVVLLAGWQIEASGGFMSMRPSELQTVLGSTTDVSPDRKKCHIHQAKQGKIDVADTCIFGSEEGKRIIVLSDSHGVEIAYALASASKQHHLQVRQLSASACPPALNANPKGRPNCAQHVARILKGLQTWPPSTIILMANYFSWNIKTADSGQFWRGFEGVVTELRRAGHNIVLLGPVPPHPHESLPRRVAKQLIYGAGPDAYAFPYDRAVLNKIDTHLRRIAGVHSAAYLPILPTVCGNSSACRAVVDGSPIYFDQHHMTVTTAVRVVKDIVLPAIALTDAASAPPANDSSAAGQVRSLRP